MSRLPNPQSSPLKVVALKLPAEEVRFFAPTSAGPKTATRTVTGVLRDVRTFFGLPAPVREVLEADMERLNVTDVRKYLAFLLVDRHHRLLEDEDELAAQRAG